MGGKATKCITCGGTKGSRRREAYAQSKTTQTSSNTSFAGEAHTIDYKRITSKYKFTEEVLGAGNFGKVFLA